ncbi:MAG: heavy-metal-associated domain-containing protein [Anaerolineae bacterium]
MPQLRMVIPNISCQHCAGAITRELKSIAGVKDINVDVAAKAVTVSYDAPASEQGIREALTAIGYAPKGA